MDVVVIESLHNLHCPQCDTRLVQLAGRRFHSELQAHVYVGEVGTLACPAGHPLPGRQELYDHRQQQGHPAHAPVSEVGLPVG